MKKNSFVFYKDWREAVKGLPTKIRLQIYESAMDYALDGKTNKLPPMASLAFNFIKSGIDRDMEKYAAIVERNRKNARKGWDKVKSNENNNMPEANLGCDTTTVAPDNESD